MRNCLIARKTLLVAILLTAALAVGCSKGHEAGKTENAPVVVARGVSLEVVKSVAAPELLEVVGTVRARTSAVVSTRIPGTVSVLKVREGDRVRKGQLLAQLDAQENQATAAMATAGIEEARRGLDEALSRKKLADTTFDRYQILFTEQAISRQEFDVRQTEKDIAVQSVARANSRLQQALAGAKAATTMSGYTRITAPISGIIISKQADLGATIFPGQPLMTIDDDGSYQLELALPENIATRVKPGSPVQVTLDAIEHSFTARIAEIVPAADPGSRTFVAKIALNHKGLKSGMFGRGAVSFGTTTNGITVPKQAVVDRGAMTSIWTVDKENIVHMRIVRVGRENGTRVEILSGLSEGDCVVVSGTEKVIEGARVE
ncbi:MAG: efflux RND transporter periplasmic adaptor subunit [Desulfuromonadaceae bacterium]|nr:efflux RND transporter periplasmic adaptor subunit [Desulfuromonadaceae bacterium]MDD5107272.1 efflux RND transporter periplasmic adaptor subunit [Desulfuromonadaceae bacterium]